VVLIKVLLIVTVLANCSLLLLLFYFCVLDLHFVFCVRNVARDVASATVGAAMDQ
jgi:hypothetical protein